jgi:tetratricopeptide (TPR) repeat protein
MAQQHQCDNRGTDCPKVQSGDPFARDEQQVAIDLLHNKNTLTFIRIALQFDVMDEGWLYVQKGWILNNMRRYREAIDAFDQAGHLGYTSDGWLYEQKMRALIHLRRYREALEASEQALRLDYTDNGRMYGKKGYVLNRLERYEEANRAFEQEIQYAKRSEDVGTE